MHYSGLLHCKLAIQIAYLQLEVILQVICLLLAIANQKDYNNRISVKPWGSNKISDKGYLSSAIKQWCYSSYKFMVNYDVACSGWVCHEGWSLLD